MGIALAMAVAGCGGDGDGESSVPDRQPREPLTVQIYGHDLHPEGPPTLVYGGDVKLFGLLGGGAHGERERVSVDLYARPAGSGTWRSLSTWRAGQGPHEYVVRPQRNTTYELRVPERPKVRSQPLRIFVDLEGELAASIPADGLVDITYRATGPAPVEAARGRVHFYVRADNRGPLRWTASARVRQAGRRTVEASARYAEATPSRRDVLTSCAVGLVAQGFGHPSASDRGCGKRTLRITDHRRRYYLEGR